MPDSNKKPQPKYSKEVSENSKNQQVHDPVHIPEFCSELQQIIDHWESLPEHIKAAIKALIQTHITE